MTTPNDPDGTATPARRTRRRRRWPLTPFRTLVAAVAVIVVAAGVVVGVRVLDPCDAGLSRENGSCIGVSDSSDFGDPDLTPVMAEIASQNRAATAGPYYSIGYLLPFEPPENRTSYSVELRHELEGAVNAQAQLNSRDGAKVKLLVANAGPDNAQWPTAVADLREAVDGPDRLRAVAGFGHSLDTTKAAISELTHPREPDGVGPVAAVASRLTADSLSVVPNQRRIDGFFRVDPTNTDEAYAAAALLKSRNATRTLLVSDEDESDDYVRSLATGFAKTLTPTTIGTFNHSQDAVAIAFDTITRNLCATPPDAVYFAGRGPALSDFVRSLAGRSCPETPVDIVTGTDVNGLNDLLQHQDPTVTDAIRAGDDHRPGGVTVTYTGLAHPAMWDDTSRAGMFSSSDLTSLRTGSPAPSDLTDGAAIMAHDAVLLTATAIERVVSVRTAVTPSSVIQALGSIHGSGAAILGASGRISLNRCGDAETKIFPILRLTAGGSPAYLGTTAAPQTVDYQSECGRAG